MIQLADEFVRLRQSDRDSQVRLMVAMKRKLTPAILRELSHDENESIRLRVARHRRTTPDVLELL
jgi:hypothetical protein